MNLYNIKFNIIIEIIEERQSLWNKFWNENELSYTVAKII